MLLSRTIFTILFSLFSYGSYLAYDDSLPCIDPKWLDQKYYNSWKKEQQREFKLEGTSSLKQIIEVGYSFKFNLERLKPDTLIHFGDYVLALYNYNFLRELLDQDPVADLDQVDHIWFEEIFRKAEAQETRRWVLEFMREREKEEEQYQPATSAQRELVKQAQETIGLQVDLDILQHTNPISGAAGSDYIAICQIPDFDYTLGVIYHELAHIVQKSFKRKIKHKIEISEVEEALRAPEMQEDIARINHYLHKGISVINTNSSLGKRLLKIVEENTTFWIPPVEHELYLRSLLCMNKERRADLFMLDTLYKLNHINAIISSLHEFGNNPANPQQINGASHPSPAERALYMLGFLASKGIDVNAEFNKWEQSGKCTSVEDWWVEYLDSRNNCYRSGDLNWSYRPC